MTTHLVHSGRWSEAVCCCGNSGEKIFRKILRHPEKHQFLREHHGSKKAFEHGILTPMPIGFHMDSSNCLRALDFEYMEIDKIENWEERYTEVFELVAALSRIAIGEVEKSLTHSVKDELLLPIGPTFVFLQEEGFSEATCILSESIECFKKSANSVFCHGDLGPHNLGLHRGRLICFDFQLVCAGPKGWDLAYFLGCFNPATFQASLSSLEQKILLWAVLVAGIKLGRRIRRGGDVAERLLVFQDWVKSFSRLSGY